MTKLLEAKWTPEKREIVASRLRIVRKELISRVVGAERALKAVFDHFSEVISTKVVDRGGDLKNLRSITDKIHQEIVYLRASLRILTHQAIRDSAKMGFSHIGEALTPIFKHNAEAYEQEIVSGRALFEAKLIFGLDKKFVKKNFKGLAVSQATQKFADEFGSIVRNQTAKSLSRPGFTPSERIWELTTRAEADLKRIVANGMGNGENPTVIARRLTKYISPDVLNAKKLGIEPGPGVYRSPYKNALRLTRTEMIKSYSQATLRFAQGKPWVSGVDINLSRSHDDFDICDENAAGGPYTIEQAAELVPAHPHCMCLIVPRIDPKYLGEEE